MPTLTKSRQHWLTELDELFYWRKRPLITTPSNTMLATSTSPTGLHRVYISLHVRQVHETKPQVNKAFIDIRLWPGIAMPLATHPHTAHCSQTWRHPQNRKYINYFKTISAFVDVGLKSFLFQRVETWPKINSELFHRLIAAREYLSTFEIALELLQRLKWFHFSFRRGYMWNETLK